MYNHVLFDLDSTLVTIEGLDWLAELAGKKSELSALTQKSMNGEIEFSSTLKYKMDTIAPSHAQMVQLGHQYIKSLTPNAELVVKTLQNQDIKAWIVTSNFNPAVQILADHLGIPFTQVVANTIYFDHKGKYAGYDTQNDLSQNHGKARVVHKLSLPGKTAMVGDGQTDAEVKPYVSTFIGFGGNCIRENVRQQSHYYITTKSLKPVLKILL